MEITEQDKQVLQTISEDADSILNAAALSEFIEEHKSDQFNNNITDMFILGFAIGSISLKDGKLCRPDMNGDEFAKNMQELVDKPEYIRAGGSMSATYILILERLLDVGSPNDSRFPHLKFLEDEIKAKQLSVKDILGQLLMSSIIFGAVLKGRGYFEVSLDSLFEECENIPEEEK